MIKHMKRPAHLPAPAALAILLALPGCQSVTEPVPVGPDTYLTGAQARGGFVSFTELRQMALRQAGEFCAKQGKRMVAQSTAQSGVRGFTPQEAEVTFRCEAQ